MNESYLMDSDEEILRLETKTNTGTVEAQARKAGLKPGMRVADIGCGSGITTSILSRAAGPGVVTMGIDLSPDRIAYAREKYGNENTIFECRDIREDLSSLGTFDFVWVRFVLEYFCKDAFRIVQGISTLVADGGILCLLDLDHNCLNHYGISGKLEKAVHEAMRLLEEKADFDPYAGRKLYSYLYRLAYRDIGADVTAHHLIYGPLKQSDAFNWLKKIEVISGRTGILLPGYDEIQDFIADFTDFFSDPQRFTYTPIIGCWGRKTSEG